MAKVDHIMAKSELTLDMEGALRYYRPTTMGKIEINQHRDITTAYEVVVETGTTAAGIIDAVRICEYFTDLNHVIVCGHQEKAIFDIYGCKLGKTFSERNDNTDDCVREKCIFRRRATEGRNEILIICFEIKASKGDFKSKNGHNFVGNLNYYVMPIGLYDEVQDEVPKGVGVIQYNRGRLRRRIDSEFRELTDTEQKWLVLNTMKAKNRR